MKTALGAAVVVAFPVLLMLGLRRLQRRGHLRPELARKLFHIGGGFLGFALPWLTPEPMVVILLTCVSIVGLYTLTRSRGLEESAGKVLTSVGRSSLGDVCFPLSVCILFLVARQQPALYYIPLLILTFGDAVAALIGVRYGLQQYVATDGYKSIEGSTAFFITAFFCVHVWLLLGTNTGRLESLLIALMLSLLVMMLEAVAWSGLDNLFIPLASFVLLRVFLRLPAYDLIARLVVTALLSVFALVSRRRTTLTPSGLFGAIFVGYVLWMGGDFRWVLIPVLLLIAYRWLSPDSEWDRAPVHDIHVVLCVCSSGLAYLFLSETFHRSDLLLPATISYSAHLAVIGNVRWRLKLGTEPPFRTTAATVLTAWLTLFLPYATLEWLGSGWRMGLLLEALIDLPGVVVAVLLYRAISPPIVLGEVDLRRWRWQAVAAALGSLAGLAPLGIAAIQKLR
jgi:phytol kinase